MDHATLRGLMDGYLAPMREALKEGTRWSRVCDIRYAKGFSTWMGTTKSCTQRGVSTIAHLRSKHGRAHATTMLMQAGMGDVSSRNFHGSRTSHVHKNRRLSRKIN